MVLQCSRTVMKKKIAVVALITKDLHENNQFYMTQLVVELPSSSEAGATTLAFSFTFSAFDENSYEMRIIFVMYFSML